MTSYRVHLWLSLLVTMVACGGPATAPSAPVAADKGGGIVASDAAPDNGETGPRLPPEIVIQSPHTFRPAEMVWSADGRTMITLSGDAMKIWDLRSDMLVRTSRVAYGTLAINPRGTLFAGTNEHGTNLHLVDLATMKPIGDGPIATGDGFSAVRFDPRGELLAAGSLDGRTRLFTMDGHEVGSLAPAKKDPKEPLPSVHAIAFDGSGARLAIADGHGARVYDMKSAAHPILCEVVPARENVLFQMGLRTTAVVLDETGAQLALSRSDGFNVLWDVNTCTQKQTFLAREVETPSSSADSKLLTPAYTLRFLGFIAGGRGVMAARIVDPAEELVRWDPNLRGEAAVMPVAPDARIARAVLSPNGKLFATTTATAQLTLFDAVRETSLRSIGRFASPAIPLAIDEKRSRLYINQERGAVDVVDLRSATKIDTVALPRPPGKSSFKPIVAMDPRGVAIASALGDDDGNKTTISIVDAATHEARTIETSEHASVVALAFTEDGSTLVASVYAHPRYELRAYDVKSSRRLWTVPQSKKLSEARVVVPSRAGGVVMITDRSSVMVHDLATGAERGMLLPEKGDNRTARGVNSISISLDGKRAATAADKGELFVWDVASRAIVKRVRDASAEQDGTSAIAFFAKAAEGNDLVYADDSGALHRYDARTYAERGQPIAHAGPAWLGFGSSSGRYLVTLGKDLSIRLDRREAASEGHIEIVASASSDYVFIAPKNRYLAPKSALSSVAFRVGAHAYPFDSFDARLNRPEAVLTELGASPQAISAAHDLTLRRAKKLGIENDPDDVTALVQSVPSLDIVSALAPPTTTQRTLPLRVRARSASSDLDRIEVFVNEVPAGVVSLRDRHARAVETPLEVTLGVGSNRVQISAWSVGGLESLRETISITLDAPAAKSNLVVVAIGVSKYQTSRLDLDYAAKDAHDTIAFLAQHEPSAVLHATEIVDGQATRARVLALESELAKTTIDDRIIVFLAGHGFLGPSNEYYFATSDVDVSSLARAAATAVSFSEIERILTKAPARQKLMLMDTCHSGELDDGDSPVLAANVHAKSRALRLVDGSEPDAGAAPSGSTIPRESADSLSALSEAFADVRRASGAVILASAAGRELALEAGAQKNGLFTYAVLDGLTDNRADRDRDGKVRVSELREFVAEKVTVMSGGAQHPTARRENVVLDFPVL